MKGCDTRSLIFTSSEGHFEVFEVERTAEIVKVYQCGSKEQVDALLKSALLLSQQNSHLLFPLQALRVLKEKQGFAVELTMKMIGEKNTQLMTEEDLIPQLKSGLEAYEFSTKTIYRGIDKMVEVEVVEATVGVPRRNLAVKRYHCGFSNINAYLQEALLQLKAESRHSCRLLDISCCQSPKDSFEVGLVMERLDEDLSVDIKRRAEQQVPYTETELLCILGDIADALVYAKLQGVAHRDIKPGNIFKNKNGWKLGDFGSACGVMQTEQGSDGTWEYLSPEMLCRMIEENLEVEWCQSDVFSLGVTMLHLAKLAKPVFIPKGRRSPMELENAVSLDMLDLGYSSSLLNLIRRMLSFDPNKRPQIEEIRYELIPMGSPLCDHHGEIGADCELPTAPLTSESQSYNDLLSLALHQLYHYLLPEAERTLLHLFSIRHLLDELQTHQMIMQFAYHYYFKRRGNEAQHLLEDLLRENAYKQSLPEDILGKKARDQESIGIQILLARIYLSEYRFDETEKLMKESLEKQERVLGEEHLYTVLIYETFAMLYFAEMKLDKARAILQASLEMSRNLQFRVLEAQNLKLLGLINFFEGRYIEAEAALLSNLEIIQQVYGDESIHLADVYTVLANIHIMQGKPSDAEVLIDLAIDLKIHWFGEDCSSLFLDYFILSKAYRDQNCYEEADHWQQVSFDHFTRFSGREEGGNLIHRFQMISNAFDSGQWEQLEQLILEAQRRGSSRQNKLPVEAAVLNQQLGSLYLMQGRAKEARECYEKSLNGMSSLPTEHPILHDINVALVATLLNEGKSAEAKSLLNHITDLRGNDQNSEPGLEFCVRMWSDFMNGDLNAVRNRIGESCAIFRRMYGEAHPLTMMLQYIADNPAEFDNMQNGQCQLS